MRRREFITLLGGAAAAWPLAAGAQKAGKVYRIGVLEQTSAALHDEYFKAFRQGLRELGYVEGQNLAIEYRSVDDRVERYPELAAQLVGLNVDLIITRGTPAALAAKNATATIPVVMASVGDPFGVVAGLAHPGGNVTGLSAFNSELEAKRVGLIRDLVPGLRRIGAFYNMGNPIFISRWHELENVAQLLGIEPQLFDLRKSEDLPPAFEAAKKWRVEALVVSADGLLQANRRLIAELAEMHGLPAIYTSREFIDVGGLISYGASYRDLYRRAAVYVDKIFKGAKPADLPVEQPIKFELIINLKAAKTLSLTVPPTLLATADEVIE
jgi:putative tryptophan/tyrosine transport system substrate-binding protein